ncbi:hypothetical protein N7494_010485 [Penicillium frequentans]|uniref:GH16 domain-containing protein n=1 Tax=Penicillium frequentans TaxID=3151616 RepID=A0AAD6G9U5_9EURO|nr:hypothetical protein N7494_010485 [Penicillium glabrum]
MLFCRAVTPSANSTHRPKWVEKYSTHLGICWYDLHGWSLRKKAAVAGNIVVVIVGVVVGAVEGVKLNEYPDYSVHSERYILENIFLQYLCLLQYTATDRTDDFVDSVDSRSASETNLTYASGSSAVIRVHISASNQTSGRKSIRLILNNQYDNGLLLFDIVYTPYGCATWPVLWLTDPDSWPENGEIDGKESNNKGADGNAMTLHTSKNCKMIAKRKETGTAQYINCLATANDNAGCNMEGKKATYGEPLNSNGGGVYVMELQDVGIRVRILVRVDIPNVISNSNSA